MAFTTQKHWKKTHQNCTQHTQHDIFTLETICRTAKLSDTQITVCKFIRFMPLLHNFTVIFENSAGQIYCTIQGIDHPAAHIHINN